MREKRNNSKLKILILVVLISLIGTAYPFYVFFIDSYFGQCNPIQDVLEQSGNIISSVIIVLLGFFLVNVIWSPGEKAADIQRNSCWLMRGYLLQLNKLATHCLVLLENPTTSDIQKENNNHLLNSSTVTENDNQGIKPITTEESDKRDNELLREFAHIKTMADHLILKLPEVHFPEDFQMRDNINNLIWRNIVPPINRLARLSQIRGEVESIKEDLNRLIEATQIGINIIEPSTISNNH